MPQVPRYGLPQVERRPLPGVRYPTDVPSGAGGVAPQIDISGLEKAAGQHFEAELDRFNQTEVQRADGVEASALETRILHDPEKGLLNLRGKNALEAKKQLDEQWTKGVSEIEKTLSNDAQRAAFRRAATIRKAQMDETVLRHTNKQLEDYEIETYEAGITNERDAATAAAVRGTDAATLLDRVSLAVARQRAAVADFAQRRGWSPEVRQQRLNDVTSATHRSVIARMLANEDDTEASKYYAEVKDALVGKDIVDVEGWVKEGTLRGESQRTADGILQKYSARGAAFEAAREIKDPKLRDLVETRLDHEFNRRNAIEREHQEDLYLRATNLVDARPGVPPRMVVPANEWAQLSLEHRRALENRQDAPGNNDDSTWLNFMSMGIEARGKLTKAQFEAAYWSKFDRSHRERAAELWRMSVDAVTRGAASPELTTAVETLRQIDNTLRIAGIIKGDKDRGELVSSERRVYARFEQEAQERINEFETTQLQGKRKATFEERQKILDAMTYNKVFTDRGWWSKQPENEKLVYDLSEDERGRAFVPFTQIPPAEAEALRRRIINAGQKVTQSKIERAYAAVMMRDPLAVLAIVNGQEPD